MKIDRKIIHGIICAVIVYCVYLGTAIYVIESREAYQLRFWDDTTLDKEERIITGLKSKQDCIDAVKKLAEAFNARPRIGGQKKTGIRGTCEQLKT